MNDNDPKKIRSWYRNGLYAEIMLPDVTMYGKLLYINPKSPFLKKGNDEPWDDFIIEWKSWSIDQKKQYLSYLLHIEPIEEKERYEHYVNRGILSIVLLFFIGSFFIDSKILIAVIFCSFITGYGLPWLWNIYKKRIYA